MTQSAHRVLSLAGGHTFLIYRKVLRRGGIIISINNDNQVVIALVNSSNANRCSIAQNPELQLPNGDFPLEAVGWPGKMWKACWRQ